MSDKVIVGLDIGGSSTKITVAADGRPGAVTHRSTVPTPRTAVVESLASMVRSAAAGRPVSRVGITIPGIVDRGQVIACANIPQLVDTDFHTDFPFPAVLANDGVAAGLAEVRLGAAAHSPDAFTMMLGTGIAGAHFVDGRLLSGAHAQASEVGHIPIPGRSRPCSCGAQGCLETVIGAPALIQDWSDTGGRPSLESFGSAVEAGDRTAVALLETAAEGFAQGLLTLSALIDPQLVVVGGGVAARLPTLVDEAVARARLRRTFHRLPEVAAASFGPWAGAVGALIVAETTEHTA